MISLVCSVHFCLCMHIETSLFCYDPYDYLTLSGNLTWFAENRYFIVDFRSNTSIYKTCSHIFLWFSHQNDETLPTSAPEVLVLRWRPHGVTCSRINVRIKNTKVDMSCLTLFLSLSPHRYIYIYIYIYISIYIFIYTI